MQFRLLAGFLTFMLAGGCRWTVRPGESFVLEGGARTVWQAHEPVRLGFMVEDA